MATQASERHRRHWQGNLRLTGLLLLVWFAVSFGMTYGARHLSFSFFGWPFSYWVGAQGALVVYVVIIGCYARRMNRLDRECVVDEVAEE